MREHVFTSESVTEGHPDKMCDQISDAVLDCILAQDPAARVACETAATTGMVLVMGEITTTAKVDIPAIVRKTVEPLGYNDPAYGFDAPDLRRASQPWISSPLTSPGVSTAPLSIRRTPWMRRI